ncbi:hypothetical protein BDV93DRAFT_160346 [Ceratobasidium sp. AG-I]|nr:hypothetical protein BDV93DRAFT_160346 [Ceratobasidium sp. AG-I]
MKGLREFAFPCSLLFLPLICFTYPWAPFRDRSGDCSSALTSIGAVALGVGGRYSFLKIETRQNVPQDL